MNELYIKYGLGKMMIHMDNFFPTTKKNMKKLLSIISLDWEHENELREKLKVYFQEKIEECEAGRKSSAKNHLDYKQKEVDTKQIVTLGKWPNGVPLSKDEWKDQKEKLRTYKAMAGECLSSFKRYEKQKAQFSEHLKMM